MISTIISIMILSIAITGITIWWVATTLKEGEKALKESKKKM
tara:strand:- start:852 stop:977 length:126 start_codon:yes stop_codon:yes gene_type:complete